MFSNKYFVVLGAFLIELTLGHLYTSGNLQKDIVDYMKQSSNSGNSSIDKNSIWIFGVISLGTGASLSFGGFLEIKFGMCITVLIGSWLMSLNFGLMYFTLGTYLSVVIITIGFFGGIGAGIAYGVALCAAAKVIKNCFNENRGIIFGITISGFGLSAAFSDSLQQWILGNHNLKLNHYFAIMGSTYFVIQILAVLLIKLKAVDKLSLSEKFPASYFSFNSESRDKLLYKSSRRQFKPHELIYEYDFWILWLLLFLTSADDSLIASMYNNHFNYNFKIVYISIVVSIFNCLGRIFWGYLFDKMQFKKIMIIMTLINAIFIGTLPSLNYMQPGIKMYFDTAWFSIINFLIGGYFSVFPSICAKLFGIQYFVCNYGMIFTSCSVSSTIVSVSLMAINVSKETPIFVIGGIISLFATLLTVVFRGRSLIFLEK